MEYQKIINLLSNIPEKVPKFITKNYTHMKKVGHTSEFPFGIY